MKKIFKYYVGVLLFFMLEVVILWKICSGEIVTLFRAWQSSPLLMQIWFFSPIWIAMAFFVIAILKDIINLLKEEKKTKKGDI